MLLTAGNQELMAAEGGIDMLVIMLASPHPHLQRQASKALANLGVNAGNKKRICQAGGVPPLVKLAASKSQGVAVEAIAALANLAVNGERG